MAWSCLRHFFPSEVSCQENVVLSTACLVGRTLCYLPYLLLYTYKFTCYIIFTSRIYIYIYLLPNSCNSEIHLFNKYHKLKCNFTSFTFAAIVIVPEICWVLKDAPIYIIVYCIHELHAFGQQPMKPSFAWKTRGWKCSFSGDGLGIAFKHGRLLHGRFTWNTLLDNDRYGC